MSLKNSKKQSVCNVCEKTFASPRYMRKHYLYMHKNGRPKPFVCTACGKGCTNSSELRLHSMTHTGERPFTCSECSKRFPTITKLKIHARTHTGEKKYLCVYCKKRFARSE